MHPLCNFGENPCSHFQDIVLKMFGKNVLDKLTGHANGNIMGDGSIKINLKYHSSSGISLSP